MPDLPGLHSINDWDDPGRRQDFLTVLYDELRKLAANKIANERPGQTLQATALVHEAYLRLAGGAGEMNWQSRAHFFSAAAEAMQRILVESARRKKRVKHGGGNLIVDLDHFSLVAPDDGELELRDTMLRLNEALENLERVDPDASRIVRLRYFAGLTVQEAAENLGISPRSADRLWSFARAWLKREMGKQSEE